MTGMAGGTLGRAHVIRGNARRIPLRDNTVDLCITSPPYFGMRSYGAGDGEIGLEAHWRDWLDSVVAATAEMVRVLKSEGSIFVDLGDKYAGGWGGSDPKNGARIDGHGGPPGAQAKSLLLLPERYRIACVDQLGLIARAVIVWNKPNCLSGGTMVYAKAKGRPLAIKVHDLCRAYQPEDVQLWNGQRWTQVLWWQPTGRHPDAEASYKAIRAACRQGSEPVLEADLEIELRSGERIGCTREHRWPTRFGLRCARDLKVGDVLHAASLPEGEAAPAALDDEMVGWFVGLYIAEGSRSEQTIQVAGHIKELERYKRLRELAEAFHGTCNVYTDGNKASVNLTGKLLDAILGTYVGGRTAKDKHLAPKCWQRSNRFLRAVLDGYLSGDGHYEAKANRWTVGFTDNDALAADLRTLGARLGLSVRVRRVTHTGFGKEWPGWSGSIVEPERRRQPDTEIVAIRQSRARQFWDIGVEDDPHLFALASGVLTHNSLPESVTDRVRRSHEDWVHLVKQPRYYSATDEIREPQVTPERNGQWNGAKRPDKAGRAEAGRNGTGWQAETISYNPLGKLPGSVWSIGDNDVWNGPINFCPRCGRDLTAGNGRAGKRETVTVSSGSPESATGEPTASPTNSGSAPSLTGSPLTTSAATEDASTLLTSSPSPASRTSPEATPPQFGTAPRPTATTGTSSPPPRPTPGLVVSESARCVCETVCEQDAPGSVWSVPSEPLRLPPWLGVDHYAAFPSEWPRRLILGWSPPGICVDCGQGRVPVVERPPMGGFIPDPSDKTAGASANGAERNRRYREHLASGQTATILGYACACTPYTDHPERRRTGFVPDRSDKTAGASANGSERNKAYRESLKNPSPAVREYHLDGWTAPPTRPAVVLDCFGGTGTTAHVAHALGRTGISLDLSADYCRLVADRTLATLRGAKVHGRVNLSRQGSLL